MVSSPTEIARSTAPSAKVAGGRRWLSLLAIVALGPAACGGAAAGATPPASAGASPGPTGTASASPSAAPVEASSLEVVDSNLNGSIATGLRL